MKKEKLVRTERVKVYKFKGLSPEAQKKAIEAYRDIEVDHDWWICEYDYFAEICASIGITVDLKRTWFRGFYSQGDGAAFNADVDLIKLVNGIEGKAWKAVNENLTDILHLVPCPVDKRVLAIAQEDPISFNVTVKTHTQFGYSTKAVCEYWIHEGKHNLIAKELYKLEKWIENCISDLSALLYSILEKQYDYLTSDEAIIESILSNGYEFTTDGSKW